MRRQRTWSQSPNPPGPKPRACRFRNTDIISTTLACTKMHDRLTDIEDLNRSYSPAHCPPRPEMLADGGTSACQDAALSYSSKNVHST